MLALLAGSALTRPAFSTEGPSLLLGGIVADRPLEVAWDPRLPKGARRFGPARPKLESRAGCSFRRPVCVHRGAGIKKQLAAETLHAAELGFHHPISGKTLEFQSDMQDILQNILAASGCN